MQWEEYQILTHKADDDSQSKPRKKSGWGANLLSKKRQLEHQLHPKP